MANQWQSFGEIGWWPAGRPARVARLIERMGEQSAVTESRDAFISRVLDELLVEFSADAVVLARRTPAWEVVGQAGRDRFKPPHLPTGLLEEVLDRDAGVRSDTPPGPLVAVPIPDGSPTVLVVGGDRFVEEDLKALLVIGRALGILLRGVVRCGEQQRRVDRLRQTLDMARTLSRERETLPLLEKMAHEATTLLDSDRASIFVWDRDQRQVIACPALGVPSGRLWLPDNKGIVGEVIQTGRAIRVDDAYSDRRFDQSVDKRGGYRTETILCVPMKDADGRCLGAFELINKHHGLFTEQDQESLEDLCIPAAILVESARERDQLVRSNQQLAERMAGQATIVGDSPPIQALRGTIDRLAATDLPVLILGESGTGKEVAAQALHTRGPRANHPFIAVNCAALTETLLESELFGHEKGAFTDAQSMHQGKFEIADGGTLFLDEIGDMSPGGQAKLLRVLEQKVITRVGGSQAIPINVRVIAATNSNLAEAVREKRFRQDLYYRLSVVTVELPPLRDRPEDILPLAKYFLEHFARQAGRKLPEISVEARRRLQAHGWPGNVRELRNLMERIAYLSRGPQVEIDDLAFILPPQKGEFDDLAEGVGLAEATNHFQQEYIRIAIKRVQGNMSEAARLLGLHRSNLYRKMRQLGMEADENAP